MVKSRLGQSLLRLERSLVIIQAEQQQADDTLAQWRERWEKHRERLSHRLELIETQFDQYLGNRAPETPQLSVVGTSSDHGDEPVRASR